MLTECQGGDPDGRSSYGGAPIIDAAKGGSHECMVVLYDRGASAFPTTTVHTTILHLAAFKNSIQCLASAIAWGVNPNAQST